MDFQDIKKLLTDPNERFVFIENGAISFVLMGPEAYNSLKKLAHQTPQERAEEIVNAHLEAERLKAKEDLAAKLAMETVLKPELPKESAMPDFSRIRLEDLPL